MSTADSERGLVLHAVRLVGFASVEDIVHRTGVSPERASEHLGAGVAEGHLRARHAPSTGWTITDDGRRWLGRWIISERTSGEATGALEETYQAFLPVNGDFLEACRRWQVIDTAAGPVVNRHDDAGYDREAARTILDLVDQVRLVLAPLAVRLPRFDRYRRRFAVARDAVRAGDHDYLTRPLVDSCHTIWFELHEDLLVTGGRSRSAEAPAPAKGSGARPGGGIVGQS